MSDAGSGLPPGWPTDEHRSRVEARARTLRNRRLTLRTTTVALVVVLLGGGFAALSRIDRSEVRVGTQPTTTTTPGQVSSVPVPEGWRIVDVGNARLATPPTWTVSTTPSPVVFCVDPLPEGYVVLLSPAPATCPSVVVAVTARQRRTGRAPLRIHGIKLFLVKEDSRWQRYAVPELKVTVDVRTSDDARAVLDTLTSSARRVVLAAGDAPEVPDDWRTVEYGGVTLRVPPTMPVTRLRSYNPAPQACSAQTFPKSGVFLGNGASAQPTECPRFRTGVAVPTDGVWISTVQSLREPIRGSNVFKLPPVVFFIDVMPDPMLVLRSHLGDYRAPTVIRLGLGADPMIARTILYSIRPTDRSG